MTLKINLLASLLATLLLPFTPNCAAQEVLLKEDFEAVEDGSPIDRWEFTDATAWRLQDGRLSLFKKQSEYKPPHRSPRHIAWLKSDPLESFELNVKTLSTHEDYNHRDVCLFFGYRSPSEYYYVHLGKVTDAHANQIFIVNNAARTKISLTTTEGTAWDEQWHQIRVVRDSESGDIKVFFDDMETPVMTAQDKTFPEGRIGLGSFDDIADFDDLEVKSLKRD